MPKVSLKELLKAGVHFGHKINHWNPKMFPYIYNEKKNIHILDLVQSAVLLNKASKYLKKAASQKKTFIFIATKPQAARIIENEAKRCNSAYVNYRWVGGMLTNWKTMKKRIKRLKNLEEQSISGQFNVLTKKEASLCRKELQKLRIYLNGVKNLTKIPDIAIIIDQKREMMAVQECRRLNIPIVSILDTNCDPDLVDIPIPGNDDSFLSIQLIVDALVDSIVEGQKKILKNK